jgi:hypothetical protein
MDQFSRIVLGYHGCEPAFADALLTGAKSVDDWEPSQNQYDWLGHGICFWEYGPHRARTWGGKGAVIGAVLQLGVCLDLTDVNYTALLAVEFEVVKRWHGQQGLALPENREGRRDLDCLVINELVHSVECQ